MIRHVATRSASAGSPQRRGPRVTRLHSASISSQTIGVSVVVVMSPTIIHSSHLMLQGRLRPDCCELRRCARRLRAACHDTLVAVSVGHDEVTPSRVRRTNAADPACLVWIGLVAAVDLQAPPSGSPSRSTATPSYAVERREERLDTSAASAGSVVRS